MHRSHLVLALLLPLLAGCTSPPTQPQAAAPVDPLPDLALTGFQQTNPSCHDVTEFQVTLTNRGAGAATAIHFTADAVGGASGHVSDVGDLAAGASMVVHGSVSVHDTCGVEDRYALHLAAAPSNGPAATLEASIST